MPLARLALLPPSAATRSSTARELCAGLVILATLVVLPAILSNYLLFQLANVFVLAIALLGLNVVTGYSGQISLGHGAFFALGAYTAAILMDRWSVPYWITPLIAGLVAFPIGFLFGVPALRLRGHYLALATFALSMALPQILKHDGLSDWTGGVLGIVLTKPKVPTGLPLNVDQWLYYLALGFLALGFAVFWNLARGRIGRALMAIRDNPIAADAMGIDSALFKTTAFAVSALYTGTAGALGAIVIQFVSPDSYGMMLSLSLLVGIVVGGLASISGALIGALFIQFTPDLVGDISRSAAWAVYGVVLIACVYAMPNGAAGMIGALGRRVGRRLHRARKT